MEENKKKYHGWKKRKKEKGQIHYLFSFSPFSFLFSAFLRPSLSSIPLSLQTIYSIIHNHIKPQLNLIMMMIIGKRERKMLIVVIFRMPGSAPSIVSTVLFSTLFQGLAAAAGEKLAEKNII